MGTRRVTQLVQEGVQLPGRCNRCYSEACGLEGGIVLEMNDDPWGDVQLGKRCIEEMAMEVGWKPPAIYEAAVDTASDLLTENHRLKQEIEELEGRVHYLRAELAAGFAEAPSA